MHSWNIKFILENNFMIMEKRKKRKEKKNAGNFKILAMC